MSSGAQNEKSLPTAFGAPASAATALKPTSEGAMARSSAVGARGSPPPRSTAQALVRLALFAAVIGISMFGVDTIINRGFRRIKTGDFGISNGVMNGTLNAEIVISGSSRALTHYDARVVQQLTGRSTVNIGLNGSQTDMQLAFLRAYLNHNAKPKLVIHNLDLFSFLTSKEIYDPAQYMPYLGEDAIYSAVKKVYPSAWKWRMLPLYDYLVEDMRFTWMIGFKGFFGIQPREDRFQGFRPRYTAWTGDFSKFRESNPQGVAFEIEPQGVRDLTAIAELCQQHGVPLLFVYSPEYFEMQQIERNRAEVFAKFREIAARLNATLWDFSDSSICRNRENFYNSQHLNADGAAAFSKDLARRLAAEMGSLTAEKPARD